MATAGTVLPPSAATVMVAVPVELTTTVSLVQVVPLLTPCTTLQYVPAGSPVVKVFVHAVFELFSATNPTAPRLKAIWSTVPDTQFDCAWPLTALWNLIIGAMSPQRWMKSQFTLIWATPFK